MTPNPTRDRIIIAALFALYVVMLPQVFMPVDKEFFLDWTLYIYRHGLQNAYNNATINYPPLYTYVMYLFGRIQGSEANIIQNFASIKTFALFFDFLPIAVLFGFRHRLANFKIPYLFLLLNIAYLFNTMIWGQVDSIYTSMVFLALVFGAFYPITGILLFVLALNTKVYAIEFLPVMAVILFYSIRRYTTLFAGIAAALLLEVVILLPFILGGQLKTMMHVFTKVVNQYNHLSINAYNIWYLVVRGNPFFINSNDTCFFLSYRNTGLLLFGASLLCIGLPFAKRIWHIRKQDQPFTSYSYQALFLVAGLWCLFFFYFNAQMHERYIHPAVIFFFFYGVASGNYKLYVLVSIPYFLTLDKAFSYPDGYLPIVHYKIIYASRMIALWYTAAVIYGGYVYYRWERDNPADMQKAG